MSLATHSKFLNRILRYLNISFYPLSVSDPSYPNLLNPINAACWNVDSSCWLHPVQLITDAELLVHQP